jgi:hypothetical protein
VQAFGEMGPSTTGTPAATRRIAWVRRSSANSRSAGRNIIEYNAAILFGLVPGAADRTFRAQIEYEF